MKKATALAAFSLGMVWEKARREASSMDDMDELPADAAAVGLALAIAGNAVADLAEAPELFDVEVDQIVSSKA